MQTCLNFLTYFHSFSCKFAIIITRLTLCSGGARGSRNCVPHFRLDFPFPPWVTRTVRENGRKWNSLEYYATVLFENFIPSMLYFYILKIKIKPGKTSYRFRYAYLLNNCKRPSTACPFAWIFNWKQVPPPGVLPPLFSYPVTFV